MKQDKQQEAVALRLKGHSVKQIEKELGVARSSVSRWVRDIVLNETQKERLKQNSRNCALSSAQKSKEKAARRHRLLMDQGRELAAHNDLFRIVCALYWGEGHKSRTSGNTSISNSDPALLGVFLKWISLMDLDFSIRLQFYEENGLSEKEIKLWWSRHLNLDPSCFRKSTICITNRASQRKKVGKLPYGTATLRIAKGTEAFWKIMGGIEYLKDLAD